MSWINSPPHDYHAISVGDGFAYIHKSVQLSTQLSMGRFSYINAGGVLGGKYPVRIGAFCSIAAELYAWTWESHDIEHVTTHPIQVILGLPTTYPGVVEKPQGITIGHDVYLGHQVRLMPGITIGNGAVVGARSVVTRDLEPYGIYGGIPARLICKRFSEPVIAALQEISYWNWPMDKIRRNVEFFDLKLSGIETPGLLYKTIKE